jgi:hypothetical protein
MAGDARRRRRRGLAARLAGWMRLFYSLCQFRAGVADKRRLQLMRPARPASQPAGRPMRMAAERNRDAAKRSLYMVEAKVDASNGGADQS